MSIGDHKEVLDYTLLVETLKNCPMGKDLNGKLNVLIENVSNIKEISDTKDNNIVEQIKDFKETIKNVIKNSDNKNEKMFEAISNINLSIKETNGNIKGMTDILNKDINSLGDKIRESREILEEKIDENKKDIGINTKRIRELELQKGKWMDRLLSAVLGGGLVVILKIVFEQVGSLIFGK